MITSVHNPKIQRVRALQGRSSQRRQERAFVVEGVRLAEEALASGWNAELVLFTEGLNPRGREVVNGFAARGAVVEQVTEPVLHAASDTQNPQGLLAVLPMGFLSLPATLDFAFIPDEVRDPGNLGAMLRTAAAAGVGVVWLPPGAAAPFAPKVVRAAMGAHFRLRILQESWDEIEAQVKGRALQVYLAAAGAGQPYSESDVHGPLALIIGGEAEGAGAEAQRLAAHCVHIPMPGGGESLNAAIAAAILLFEVVRQRSLP